MYIARYSLYLIESMGSATSSALWQIYTATEAHQHFHKMMDSAPWMRWTLRCYHLKPNVNPEHHKPTDRIYTHCKTISYPLQGCADETPMNFFTSHRLCKVSTKAVSSLVFWAACHQRPPPPNPPTPSPFLGQSA